jgi:hypothetical protein
MSERDMVCENAEKYLYAFLDTVLDRKHFDVARAVVNAATPLLRAETISTFLWEIEKEENQAEILEAIDGQIL